MVALATYVTGPQQARRAEEPHMSLRDALRIRESEVTDEAVYRAKQAGRDRVCEEQ